MTNAVLGDGQADPSSPPLVEVRAVSKSYGATRALTSVNLAVRAGRTHALVGRNGAGKSTLVSTLTGLEAPDTGHVLFAGEPAPPVSSPHLWRRHVACVYQHRRLVPALSVAENLLLNRYPGGNRGISWREVHRQATAMLEKWEIDVDPRAPASTLSVEDAQFVEIVRALSEGSRFVILDEPTAQLVASGIRRLFRELKRLKESGVTFLFISHHLEEVAEICEEVSVLRNGTVVDAGPVDVMTEDRMVASMVGHAVTPSGQGQRTRSRGVPSGAAPALALRGVEVDGLSEPVDLEVAPGEVVGLGGLFNSGSRQLGLAVAGMLPVRSGSVERDGHAVRLGTVQAAIRAGIAFVPEDRHEEGYVAGLSIEDNINSSVLDRLGRWGLVSPRRRAERPRALVATLDVACSSTGQYVGSLSGGNQQKVVLGRALATGPRVLVLIHPTAGVDVASKDTLFDAVEAEAAKGTAVLVVSDEVDELRRCDRVEVFLRGRHSRSFPDENWTDHEMVSAMEGVEEHV
ncbi:MAG TPA: sugar ABC transporter ATP-binding protein [Blastococcus sp.]|jgi:simple sugar transport system ATP-binding protein